MQVKNWNWYYLQDGVWSTSTNYKLTCNVSAVCCLYWDKTISCLHSEVFDLVLYPTWLRMSYAMRQWGKKTNQEEFLQEEFHVLYLDHCFFFFSTWIVTWFNLSFVSLLRLKMARTRFTAALTDTAHRAAWHQWNYPELQNWAQRFVADILYTRRSTPSEAMHRLPCSLFPNYFLFLSGWVPWSLQPI